MKGLKEARRIIVRIGGTAVVFPLHREWLASRHDAVLTAKRLRPAAVEYLRGMERQLPDSFTNAQPVAAAQTISAPPEPDFSWDQGMFNDFSGSEPAFFELDISVDTEDTSVNPAHLTADRPLRD
jgi:hypothetical protein